MRWDRITSATRKEPYILEKERKRRSKHNTIPLKLRQI
jgi:hypothetical protein